MLLFSGATKAHSINHFFELSNFQVDLVQKTLHLFVELVALLVCEG